MTRGRPPQKALDDALRVARTRGVVLRILQDAECAGDLMIMGGAQSSIIRVRRTLRLHCSLKEIEVQFADSIRLLRLVPGFAGIQRELWVWSRYGSWRFFRVEDTTLMELAMIASP